jgi:hypothetical protein
MRRRILVVVVLALLLVAGGAQAALADQGRGAIQFRGEVKDVAEGLPPVPQDPLPGGRWTLVNEDSAWIKLEFTSNDSAAAKSLSGWYLIHTEQAILQPGDVVRWSGSWELWLSEQGPQVDDTGRVHPPADGARGPWSGTVTSTLQVGDPEWGNARFHFQGVGCGDWDGWAYTLNSSFKQGDMLAMRISGHLTPPRPGGRPS